ncbi:hypothetical protein [Pseudosulfitobacter sp. SM2401]|uniref:hypothetical protein n=1 Tax=Pseudosulfitobacter sp. SM2401 TaxID=3350098 RepID=UPI0036F1CDBF
MDQVAIDSASTEDLLNVVYDVSADPASFQTLTTAFEQWIWPKIEDSDNTDLENYFASHFERAEGILAHISSHMPDTQLSEHLDQTGALSNTNVLLFDDQLKIVSGSGAAQQSFSLKPGDLISDLPILPEDIPPLLQHANKLLAQGQDTQSFLRVRHQDGQRLIILQIRVVSHEDRTFLAAVSSNVHWPNEYQEWLHRAYGLTSAECEIVRLIVDCQNITEIAHSRGRSEGTIRNQVKSIFAKTGSRNQAELVRLAMSIMQVAAFDDDKAIYSALQRKSAPTSLPHVPVNSVTGPDGRNLDYLILGDPEGAPVIYLQTELGLTRLPQFVEDNARRRGMRVISPIRAGFGNSDPVPKNASFSKQVAQDLLTVMDHEGITSLPVISIAADNAFPAYMHILRPGSVKAIIATSGCFPFENDDQAARQHATHRLMHSTARYFPRLLPFVAKASFAFIRKTGKEVMIKLIFKNAPHDLKLFENPDVRAAVLEGSDVGLSDQHSAHEAFILQCLSYHDPEQLTLLPRLKADGVPYHSLNGLKDPSMHADTVAENQERHAWIDFHIYPEAGQWLFFQHPDDVFDLVERFLVK